MRWRRREEISKKKNHDRYPPSCDLQFCTNAIYTLNSLHSPKLYSQCTYMHVSKKMRNEKRKNIETKDERNGARPFSYHITSSSIYLSLDTHSPYLTPSKKKLFKQTEKKSKTWSIFMEIIFKK